MMFVGMVMLVLVVPMFAMSVSVVMTLGRRGGRYFFSFTFP